MTELLKYRFKAGILPLTLSLSLVVASICAAMIIVAYYYRLGFVKYDIQERLFENAKSGMAYFFAQSDLFDYDSPYYVDLFQEMEDSVELVKTRWGLYDLATVKAFQGNHQVFKASLVGYQPTDKGRSALYLADERRPLSIAGETLIKGDVYLPAAGVRTTYINRQGYTKKELVYGRQSESDEELPALNSGLLEHIKSLCLQSGGEMSGEEGAYLTDTIFNSFQNPASVYFSDSEINLTQLIVGKVIIHSSQAIIVHPEAHLEDVILAAPFVHVMENFRGQAQLFASDSILVDKNCRLAYPSSLSLYGPENGNIKMKDGASIQGLIFLSGAKNDYDERILYIGENAKITGQIYADGYVEHKGTVHGNLTCRKFLLQLEYSVYENHLFNGVLDSSFLPGYYLGANLWEYGDAKSVIKWLR